MVLKTDSHGSRITIKQSIISTMSFAFLHRCGTILVHPKTVMTKHFRDAWLNAPRNFSGSLARKLSESCSFFSAGSSTFRRSTLSKSSVFQALISRKNTFKTDDKMGYFVIGVSGVTCGGKTTLTKLLLRKFPWAMVIHQDHYFYDDDYPLHIRVPESENHVNYEILEALNMEQMYKDVQAMLDAPPKFATPSLTPQSDGAGDKAETPNFDDTFLQQIPDINFDVAKYNKVPILIIEGFTIFGSQYLFDKCDVRFFCSLDKESCRERRVLREYFPPDSPSYFEKIIWPEYQKHYDNHINKRSGLTVFDGKTLMADLWKTSVQIITCRIEEKFGSAADKAPQIGV